VSVIQSPKASDEDEGPERTRRLPTWLLSQVTIRARRLLVDALAPYGAGRHHYPLLAALEEFGPCSQATLMRRCGIDRSDVAGVMNILSADGYVERVSDPTDRRRNVVTITAAGRRQLRRLDRALDGVQDELLAPLSATERTELARLLTKVFHASG